MEQPSAIARLSRRLGWVGTALLVGAVVAFVYAIGFTEGVDGLVDGLIVTSVGFLIPGLVVYWVAWFVGTADADERGRRTRADGETDGRRRAHPRVERAARYGVAVVATALAWLLRAWLAIYLDPAVPFATFFLAVAVSAWYGGVGPGIVATVLGLLAAWYSFVAPYGSFALTTPTDLVSLGLYGAVSLCIVGLTSGLQAARARSAELLREIAQRNEDADDGRTLHDAVEQTPAMIWITNAAGEPLFVNPALLRFIGTPDMRSAWNAWGRRLHPDDRAAVEAALRAALEARAPVTQRFRMLRRDDVYRSVAFEAHPRFDEEGRFCGYAGTMLDLAPADDAPPGPLAAAQPR